MRTLGLIPTLLIASLVAGCADGTTPTAPSSVAAPAPPADRTTTVAQIRGYVFDSALRALPGARVDVLDGAAAGVSAAAGSDGAVVLNGSFDSSTRFRATISGHESLTMTWRCSVAECANNAAPWFAFYLRPLAPAVDLAGDYTMTIAADASCSSLPEKSRSRSYPATITPRYRDGTADLLGFDVLLQADSVLERYRRLSISVAGDFVSFIIGEGHGDEPALVEQLGDHRYVAFAGAARQTVDPAALRNISLGFEGAIDDFTLKSPWPNEFRFVAGDAVSRDSCSSIAHRLVLTRK